MSSTTRNIHDRPANEGAARVRRDLFRATPLYQFAAALGHGD